LALRSSALHSPRSDFRLALALAGGSCLIACCEATRSMNKGLTHCESRQFGCSRTCLIRFLASLRYFSHPSCHANAIYARRFYIPQLRRGRLRVWIKNTRHASLSHTNSPSSPGTASCCGSQTSLFLTTLTPLQRRRFIFHTKLDLSRRAPDNRECEPAFALRRTLLTRP